MKSVIKKNGTTYISEDAVRRLIGEAMATNKVKASTKLGKEDIVGLVGKANMKFVEPGTKNKKGGTLKATKVVLSGSISGSLYVR